MSHYAPYITDHGAAPVRDLTDPVVDTHIHLWDRSRVHYPWLDRWQHLGERVDAALLTASAPGLAGAVFIEAAAHPEHASAELAWLAEQADACPFPVRIVAQQLPGDPRWWSTSPAVDRVAGLRRVMHHSEPGLLVTPEFVLEARAAGEAGLVVDLTIRHEQLDEVARLCEQAPETQFVLDHLGKPSPHTGQFDAWANALDQVATQPNVMCKLSSIAVQAGDPRFEADVAETYVVRALSSFGPSRCLYGTDWPVLSHATSFRTWLELVVSALATYGDAERREVLGGNAQRVYGFQVTS